MRKPCVTFPWVVAFTLPVLAQERSTWDEGAITHLAALSSAGFEAKPDISDDKLTLLFASDQTKSAGDLDLWMTTRPDLSSPWGPQQNVSELNFLNERDHTPTTTADGLLILFSSSRPGGLGTDDAWMATRADTSSPWNAPVHVPELSSSARDMGFTMTPDGLEVFFTSNRPGGQGNFEIYTSSRPTRQSAWAAPTLVAEINSPLDDRFPTITGDGLNLYFSSNRLFSALQPGTPFTSDDFWVAMRTAVDQPFTVVENVESLNLGSSEFLLSVSNDETEIFFASDRTGGLGGLDLYSTTAIPSVRRFGAGTDGEFDAPRIRSTGGAPTLGNAGFQVEVTFVSATAFGLLAIGFAEGTAPVLVDLGGPVQARVFQDFMAGDPDPTLPRVVPLPIPGDAGLVGLEVFLQAFLFGDPFGALTTPTGVQFAATGGLKLTILP
jgi:hypothetical protein